MTVDHLTASRRLPAPEEGSVYMLVLLLLFILTIVGLSLTAVTQTEIVVGSNERSIERVFYAAESGIGVAAARLLEDNNYEAFAFDVKGASGNAAGDHNAVDRIGVYPIVPIADQYCNLCDIREGFYKINHSIRVDAERLIGEKGVPKDPVQKIEEELGGGASMSSADDGMPVARKSMTVMIELQPTAAPDPESLALVPSGSDPQTRSKVLTKVTF